MSFATLAETIARPECAVVSSDLFDTVLLRDHTTETQRFADVGREVGRRLGLDQDTLVSLRWTLHASGYRAVALERPLGEARLDDMARAMATAVGLDDEAARLIADVEVEVDARHLRAHRQLIEVLAAAADAGKRVVAVSDTYYSEPQLRTLLSSVVGAHPFAAVYSSADLGATKHAGSIFDVVTASEGIAPERVVHVGDDQRADVDQPAAAGWVPVHLPRGARHLAARRVGRVRSSHLALRRAR